MQLQLASLVSALAAINCVTATPVVAGERAIAAAEFHGLEKRTGFQIVHKGFTTSDCNSTPLFDNVAVVPGNSCQDLPGPIYRAQIYHGQSQVCVIKYWQNKGCSGEARTFWFAGGDQNFKCFATNANTGAPYIDGGVRSVSLSCARDPSGV